MSAVLPRSKNSKFAKPLSHSNKDECKKKTFTGTNVSGKSKSSIKSQEAEAPIQDHPWSSALESILRPLPPDVRYNIQRFVGGIGEAIGNLLPNQNNQNQIRVGRRGF